MGQNDFVYIGAGAGGGGIDAKISGNTSGTTALVSTGTMVLAGGNNITLSQNGQSITISGAALPVGQSVTNKMWQRPIGSPSSFQVGQSSVKVEPIWMPNYLTASRVDMGVSASVSTSSNSSFAFAVSFEVGIYTANGSSLSLASSGGVGYTVSEQSGGSISLLSGFRPISVPINLNMTPGDYWVAVHSITNSTNANWLTMSNMAWSNQQIINGSFGITSVTSNGSVLGLGHLNFQTAHLPNAIEFKSVVGTGSMDNRELMLAFCNTTV